MGIISKSTTKFLLSKDKRGFSKDQCTRKHGEVVHNSVKAIEKLTLIAQHLPEEYLDEVFSQKLLSQFFTAILKYDGELDNRRVSIAIMLARKGLLTYIDSVQNQYDVDGWTAIHEVMKVPLAILRAADRVVAS